jgi:hypothetical protein
LPVISFVDNDALLKLTACDLFWDAIALLGVQPTNVKVLVSTEFVIRGNKSINQQYSEEIRTKAIALIKGVSKVSTDQANPFLSLQVPGLDLGELTLIHAAISEPSFYLATGDKRCLRALVNTPELNTARQKLNGKVVCVEQLIAELITVKGFETVRQKVVPARDCDTALKVAFGSGNQAQEDNVLWALEQCIQELRRDCPDLLMRFS